MATLTQAIATYSYIDRPSIDLGTVNQNDPDIALLLKVNALMAAGAAAFNSRQYSDAISSYQAAESLIYSILDPAWIPELGIKLRPLLPRNPELFAPLLSATSQWLNIVRVAPPASPVRPVIAVNRELLNPVANLEGAGPSVVSANPANALSALADMRLATIYAGQGNTKASASAVTSAQRLDPTIAKALLPPGIKQPRPVRPAPEAATERAT